VPRRETLGSPRKLTAGAPVDRNLRFVVILKGIAGIAAIVAILCPLGSFTQIFLFAASAAVALICYVALTNLDATHVENGGDGYWPKPLDWNPPSKAATSTDDGTPRTKI
jgi:hypothetical protein